MSGSAIGGAGQGPAALRRARAERLARLRGASGPARGGVPEGLPGSISDPAAEDPEALADFLRALGAAVSEHAVSEPAVSEAAPEIVRGPTSPAAEVLPFQRAPDRAAPNRARLPWAPASRLASDLDRLPGAGPGLVWALERAGIARLADLAEAAPEALASRLGPPGVLLDLPGWIRFARAAAPQG